jgi:hypothetical protein
MIRELSEAEMQTLNAESKDPQTEEEIYEIFHLKKNFKKIGDGLREEKKKK